MNLDTLNKEQKEAVLKHFSFWLVPAVEKQEF